jgi:hypothetical protein
VAATTINQGVVDTSVPLSNRLKVDMHDPIRMLDPDVSQFSTMLSDPRLPSEKAGSYIVEWLEDRLVPRTLSIATSITGTADTIIVTGTNEGLYAKSGDILRVPQTGEALRVTSATASSLTVVRAVGSAAAATAGTGALGGGSLIIVGGSNKQGGSLPTRLITQQTRNYNYTQIVRNAYGFTRTAQQSNWWGGTTLLEWEREKKASEHKTDIENTLFFGARSYTASTGPQHTAGGLQEYISTNKTNAAGTWSKASMQTFLTGALQYGSQNKVFFCSPLVAQVVSAYLADNWVRADVGTTLFGAHVTALISGAFGTNVPVVVKRQWGSYGTATSGQYQPAGMGFVVDLDAVALSPMQTSVRLSDRQANDADGVDEEYLAELSFICRQEPQHALVYGVTG